MLQHMQTTNYANMLFCPISHDFGFPDASQKQLRRGKPKRFQNVELGVNSSGGYFWSFCEFCWCRLFVILWVRGFHRHLEEGSNKNLNA